MKLKDQLNWLTENTTIIWIERHSDQKVVAGVKREMSRFTKDQGSPISFKDKLEKYWQILFKNFGCEWGEERQLYRLLYDSMRSYFVTFSKLTMSKNRSINALGSKSDCSKQNELSGSLLLQMYMVGKKAIDITKKLRISDESRVVKRFTESRNKLFEHNYNPHGKFLPDLIIEPDLWFIVSTSSQLPIYIHTSKEREYQAFIDYYQDYYDLEEIFVKIVKNFSKKSRN